MKEMCQEMINLRAKLNILGIQWYDASDDEEYRKITYKLENDSYSKFFSDCSDVKYDIHDCGIDRTHFNINDIEISVINGYGTYGGYKPHRYSNKGLLEYMDNKKIKTPIGYLTANDVFNLLKETYNINIDLLNK